MEEIWLVDVGGDLGMLDENAKGVPIEVVVDGSVDMLFTVDKLGTADIVLKGTSRVVDNTVGAVLIVCVVMLPQCSSQQKTLIS